jgi:flavin reductase (DIM6/NTAB) family NADH-FMN oxidoreductase RutF
MFHNYTLLISGIAPRPIGFLSTLSAGNIPNLAPFSYFQLIDHDPPTFVIGFSTRPHNPSRPKDSLRNLRETGECVINMVGEHMIDAVNATSLDAPFEVDEWEIAGLTKAESVTVRPKRVRESVFAVEGKVLQIVEYGGSSRGAAGVEGAAATGAAATEEGGKGQHHSHGTLAIISVANMAW